MSGIFTSSFTEAQNQANIIKENNRQFNEALNSLESEIKEFFDISNAEISRYRELKESASSTAHPLLVGSTKYSSLFGEPKYTDWILVKLSFERLSSETLFSFKKSSTTFPVQVKSFGTTYSCTNCEEFVSALQSSMSHPKSFEYITKFKNTLG